jgi:hypothetical protein
MEALSSFSEIEKQRKISTRAQAVKIMQKIVFA